MGDDTLFVVTDRDERARFVERHDCGARSATQQFGHSAMLLRVCETITVEWRLVRRSAYRGAIRVLHRRHSRRRSSEVSRHAAVARNLRRRRGRSTSCSPIGARRPTDQLAETSTTYDTDELQRQPSRAASTSVWPPTWVATGGRRCRCVDGCASCASGARSPSSMRPRQPPSRCRTGSRRGRSNQSDDDNITVLIGTDAIVEARDGICDEREEGDLRLRQAALRPVPPQRHRGEPERQLAGVAGPRARDSSLRCVYHPGFDATGWPSWPCSPTRASSRGPLRCR